MSLASATLKIHVDSIPPSKSTSTLDQFSENRSGRFPKHQSALQGHTNVTSGFAKKVTFFGPLAILGTGGLCGSLNTLQIQPELGYSLVRQMGQVGPEFRRLEYLRNCASVEVLGMEPLQVTRTFCIAAFYLFCVLRGG